MITLYEQITYYYREFNLYDLILEHSLISIVI